MAHIHALGTHVHTQSIHPALSVRLCSSSAHRPCTICAPSTPSAHHPCTVCALSAHSAHCLHAPRTVCALPKQLCVLCAQSHFYLRTVALICVLSVYPQRTVVQAKLTTRFTSAHVFRNWDGAANGLAQMVKPPPLSVQVESLADRLVRSFGPFRGQYPDAGQCSRSGLCLAQSTILSAMAIIVRSY